MKTILTVILLLQTPQHTVIHKEFSYSQFGSCVQEARHIQDGLEMMSINLQYSIQCEPQDDEAIG